LVQNIDAVYSATYSANGQKLLITASYKGKIDIAEFYPLSKRTVWLTQDVFDDFSPIYINSENTKIAYNSTRPTITATDSTPPQLFTDIFVLYNTDTARQIYLQATYTPTAQEHTLQTMKTPTHFSFVSDQAGVQKYYEARLFTMIDSIIYYKNPQQKPDTIYKDLVMHSLSEINLEDISHYQKTQLLRLQKPTNQTDSTTVRRPLPLFMPELDLLPLYTDSLTMALIDGDKNTDDKNNRSATSKTKFYTPVFAREYAHINFGNALMHPDMPVFITSSSNLPSRDFGVVATAGITDLFENHKIAGGARLSNTLSNNDFFVLYQNRTRRIDKKMALHYQTYNQNAGSNGYVGIRNTELIGEVSYPINPHSVVRMSGMARRIYAENLSSDLRPLTKYGDTTYRTTLRIEYTFDNTKQIAANILLGARCKVFVENFGDFYKTKPVYGTVVGFDCRQYTSIYKNFIWANRWAGNASLGSQKVLYSAGGTDNWLNAKVAGGSIDIGDNAIATQATATNLRGFGLGARAGFNYFLMNSELRLPVFALRRNQSMATSSFIKNLQLMAFVDVGSAWVGANPFSLQNPNNYEIYETPPVRVLVYTRANPFLVGYGVGLRTKLVGYWVRADYATGIDNNLKNKPMLHISLGFDF
jgi:hypothetical protein